LIVAALRDEPIRAPEDQRTLHHALHGSPNELLQVPGSAHGVGLLVPPAPRSVRDRVLRFVLALLPHG
jgi:hypothetical protein